MSEKNEAKKDLKPFLTFRGDQELNEILERHLPKDFSRVSYAIAKGTTLLASGAVSANKEQPADLMATHNVASISKVFCAISVMMLVEQGKVDLDEPVISYLPEFKTRDLRSDQITLRHCLSHTSGLPGTQWKGFAVTEWDDSYYQTALDYFQRCRLKAAPGQYSVYCNDGFTLAEMVVAKVTGEKYAHWCQKHITDPLGMNSTRLTLAQNPDYPTVEQKKFPVERMLIGGAAGFTTTMEDLVKLGQVFLSETPILSQASVQEMARFQGVTFLKEDKISSHFGLGWDNCNYHHKDFDLGEGVCYKGGNSFQHTSAFFVIPKYDLTVAISVTHDCKFNGGKVPTVLFYLLQALMARDGVNLTRDAQLIPQEVRHKIEGPWLLPSAVVDVCCYGSWVDIAERSGEENRHELYETLKYDGTAFYNPATKDRYFVVNQGKDSYLMFENQVTTMPYMQKAVTQGNDNEKWNSRLGHQWIVSDVKLNDLVIHEVVTGFELKKLESVNGVYLLHFSSLESDVYSSFDAPVKVVDDTYGEGFLTTPGNGSRDAMHPEFCEENGQEICYVASYRYLPVEGLPVFNGEFDWPQVDGKNKVYRIDNELKELPKMPTSHRVMVLNDKLAVVYDSLFEEQKFESLEKGYLILI